MRFSQVAIEAVVCVLPPRVVTSAEIEVTLAPVYERLRLPPGRLELMTGIHERRFWDPGTRPSTVAARAGQKALDTAGMDAADIGVLIHGSVCRDFLEPATASVVHETLGLPPACTIFDLSNACLGVLNGMIMVANMIEAGQVKSGLVVSGEVAEPLHRATVKRLLGDPGLTRAGFKDQFASLTIGSGAAAVLLRHVDDARAGHRLLGGAVETDSSANRLCREKPDQASDAGPLMATDAEALLHAGCALADRTWQRARKELDWTNGQVDRVFTHQVGSAHRRLMFETLGLDLDLDFPTIARTGNTGSAALPGAWALGIAEAPIASGAHVALLGIGSGLSSLMLGVEW